VKLTAADKRDVIAGLSHAIAATQPEPGRVGLVAEHDRYRRLRKRFETAVRSNSPRPMPGADTNFRRRFAPMGGNS
jgi:hypothetical protein